MRIAFSLSLADYAAFGKILRRRLTELSGANSRLSFTNLFIWVPLGIAFAAYAALYRKYPDMTHDLSVVAIAFGLGIVMMTAGIFYKQHIYRKAMFSQQGLSFAELAAELGPDGISVTSSNVKTQYQWAAFIHLAEDASNLYLFVDNAQALILPKSVLGSPEQILQVKSWVRA